MIKNVTSQATILVSLSCQSMHLYVQIECLKSWKSIRFKISGYEDRDRVVI